MKEEKVELSQDALVKKVTEQVTDAIGDKLAAAIEKMGDKIKEPTKAEALKLKQEALLRKRIAEARRDEGIKSYEAKEARIERCRRSGHVISAPGAKGAIRHGWRGAVNSDGCIRPSCIACNLTLPPFKAPMPILQGSSVNEWFEQMTLTEDTLIKWSKQSNPEYWVAQEKKEKERKEFIETFRSENEAAGLTA